MSNNSEENKKGNSFEYRLREVSNEEIISILRYRDHFQKTAVNAAIKEALKREIISSVEDLDRTEFQPQPLAPRSLFPISPLNPQNYGIFKSLCRIFYGFGLLPIIYGILNISKEVKITSVIAILIGIAIIFVANRLEKTMQPFYSNIILSLNVPALGLAFYILSSKEAPTIMDGMAISIVILVLLYTTFYANKLTSHFNKLREEEED